MTLHDDGPTSGKDAAGILADARRASGLLQDAVSGVEGWWTIASAGAIFAMTAYTLHAGNSGEVGFLLVAIPVAIILARYRRASGRVHPRTYQRWYTLAAVWAMVVAGAGGWYWLLSNPARTGPLLLTSAVALVAALPLAFVGARLVAGGRSW